VCVCVCDINNNNNNNVINNNRYVVLHDLYELNERLRNKANRDVPILAYHGRLDENVLSLSFSLSLSLSLSVCLCLIHTIIIVMFSLLLL